MQLTNIDGYAFLGKATVNQRAVMDLGGLRDTPQPNFIYFHVVFGKNNAKY